MNLLVVSNLFPDQNEPWRGLDNATLVHALRELDPGLNIRVQAFRPSLRHLGRAALQPRAEDAGCRWIISGRRMCRDLEA